MEVYQVIAQAELTYRPEDQQVFNGENFSGVPFPKQWKRMELSFAGRAGKALDFYALGSKALVCSEKASLWCGPFWDEGEFLPVKIKGLKGKYYLYNVTHCCSHVNLKKTIWKKDARTGMKTIKSPAFHAERLGEDCVFKIPEDGGTAIYTLERDDVPGHEGLKYLAKNHKLTGLKFKLVWTDAKRSASNKKNA